MEDVDYIPGYIQAPPSLSAEELEAIRELTYNDPEEFGYTFLPNKFNKKMPWVHKGILAILTGRVDWLLEKCTQRELDKILKHFTWKEDPSDLNGIHYPLFIVEYDRHDKPCVIHLVQAKYTEIIMPRGFSKTTLVGLLAMLYKIVFQENKFIVYVSETATAAELQLGNVKYELASNPMLHLCFGNLKPDRTDERKWTQNMFQTMTDIVVTARGRGGQIRGLNVGAQRPDCILIDDVEDRDSVKTKEQREKTREWFYGDVMPALPAMDENATIICLGTVLHPEALLMVLQRDPEWTSVILGAVDMDGEPLWADNMTLRQLEAKKAAYSLAGMLPAFYREYMSVNRADETRIFSGPFIIRPEWREELDAVAIACDPAISESRTADFFALGVVGVTHKGNYLLRDIFLEIGVPADKQAELFLDWSIKYECTLHGVEAIAYQSALITMIQRQMYSKGKVFVIESIRHGRTRKDERIRGILSPVYSNKMLAHEKSFPQYEAQVLDFPDGKKDGADVVAMAIKLLSPFNANLIDPESVDFEKNEYEPLGDWQQY